jgi:hypothetical protein
MFKWQIKYQSELDKMCNEELLNRHELYILRHYTSSDLNVLPTGRVEKEFTMLEEEILKRMNK